MRCSRREMLKLTAGGSAWWLAQTSGQLTSLASQRGKIPIALELYSVRDQCDKDLAGVLAAVADMGYEGVELAHSFYGHTAAQIRQLLDKNGLKSCGMHMSLPALQGDTFKRTVEDHQVLGSPYLILASLPKKNLASRPALEDTAKMLDELTAKLKPYGMKTGYHCHPGDFEQVEGRTPWEVIGESTNADFVMQMDTHNCLSGGGDPIALLKKFPGRADTIHLKEHSDKPGTAVGEGTVNWQEVFSICESTGGTKWYIVEEESQKGPESLQLVRRCLENLRKMGK